MRLGVAPLRGHRGIVHGALGDERLGVLAVLEALPGLPGVREVLCTGAYYLLEWSGDE